MLYCKEVYHAIAKDEYYTIIDTDDLVAEKISGYELIRLRDIVSNVSPFRVSTIDFYDVGFYELPHDILLYIQKDIFAVWYNGRLYYIDNSSVCPFLLSLCDVMSIHIDADACFLLEFNKYDKVSMKLPKNEHEVIETVSIHLPLIHTRICTKGEALKLCTLK